MKYLAVLLAVCAIGVGAGAGSPAALSTGTRLRIESFGGRSLPVDVYSGPAGLWLETARADSVEASLRTATPVTLFVADSVQWLRVVVVGTGAVKLFFDDTLAQGSRGPIWGRDVRLRRVDGRFQPTTQIIPLHP